MRIISKSLGESLLKYCSSNPRVSSSAIKSSVFRRAYCDAPDDSEAKAAAAQAKLNSLLGSLKKPNIDRITESPDKELKLAKPIPKRGPKRNRDTGKPVKNLYKSLDDEVVEATKQVANIIKDPVKRDKTESDLLKKLKNVQSEARAAKYDDKVDGEPESIASIAELIQDLNVEKKKKVKQDDGDRIDQEYDGFMKEGERPQKYKKEMTLEQVAFLEKRKKMRMEASRKRMEDAKPVDIFGGEPLGVFLEPVVADQGKEGELKMWRACVERELRILSTPSPRNALEEMILWTEQGKLWHFPIRNEYGIDSSHDPFHKHVFLEHNLEPWCPPSGPVRHFMELVCVGLSKNPYMTSQKKVDTIIWFKDYFERPESIEILNDVGAWEFESTN